MGDEGRFVLAARAGERLVAPKEPVHRVAGVLKEVGAFLGRGG